MRREGLITIMFAWAETPRRFHSRNPFASGGVYEDPATGAATAAFAGYLRDRGWAHGGGRPGMAALRAQTSVLSHECGWLR